MKKNTKIKMITQMGIVGALYVVFTLVFQPVSYGPIQFRPAEAFIVLVAFGTHFKYGLTVGVFLANLLVTGNPFDMVLGSLITLISCCVAEQLYKVWKKPIALILPHLIFTPLGVSSYLTMLYDLPYIVMVFQLLASCLLNNLVIGIVVYGVLKNHEHRI